MTRLARIPVLLTLLLALGAAGCSRNSEPQSGPSVGDSGEPARVDVSNFNWLDMAIYAVRGSMRVRLGTVTSMNREVLTIPNNMLASSSAFHLVASPIGSTQDYTTYPVDIWPGDTIEFKIENNLGTSTTTTW